MESAYSVTRLSVAYMVGAHTHTHTPQSMITHQGFRVESWSLTYRCYICRSLGLVVERPQCASLFAGPRLLHATLARTTCVQRFTDTDATSTRCSQPGERVSLHLLSLSSVWSRIQLSIPDLCFNGTPKSCLITGFVNTCNRDRPITITTGLRFGFKIKSHKFLWEHLKKLLQNKD